ncbi:MAG: MarR family transcriptional regulator, partial [Thermoguttaceae bacterium]|nr:MarR family transcriptional regulator [Thermoguttaceae bacterium]
FSILRHVSGNGALSVTELSELMGLDRTTLSRNLTLLERRGLLTTQPSSGRRRLTTLTDKGIEALERAFVRWRSAQEEMEKRLGKERMERLEDPLNALLTEL